MSTPLRTILLTRVLPLCAALLCLCAHNDNNLAGGSGTETVGRLVDTLGTGVADADVYLRSRADTSLVQKTLTDRYGCYRFDAVAEGPYALFAVTADSSLLFSDTLLEKIPQVPLDAGTDTMRAPGYIRGRVLLDGVAHAGLEVMLAGESWTANTDEAGFFLMSHVPAGSHTLVTDFALVDYIQETIGNVVVHSGDTTQIGDLDLLRNPDAEVPVPQGLRVISYDTVSGTIALAWDPLRVGDLAQYVLYEKDDIDTAWRSIGQYLSSTAPGIALFANTFDTVASQHFFKVQALDNSANASRYSDVLSYDPVPPGLLRTFFSWGIVPDTIVDMREVKLAVSYHNRLRRNTAIVWSLAGAASSIASTVVDDSIGSDTLSYAFPEVGMHRITVSAVDDHGAVWTDSISLDIRDSSVLYPRNVWYDDIPALTVERRYTAAVSDEAALFVFGGAQDNFLAPTLPLVLSDLETFGIAARSWTADAASTPALRQMPLLALVNNRLYVAGGEDTLSCRTIDVYDAATSLWQDTIAVPLANRRSQAALCVLGDTLVFAGGRSLASRTAAMSASVDGYVISTRTWIHLGNLSQPRVKHQAVVLDGKIMVLGGQVGSTSAGATASVEIFDPATGSSSPAASLLHPRMIFGTALVDGVLYALGGITSISTFARESTVEMFDPLLGNWSLRTSIPDNRFGFGTTVSKGQIYLFGGADGGSTGLGQLGTVLRYIP